MFLSLYDELDTEQYYEKLQDYLFLDKELRVGEVIDALNALRLIGFNGRVQIEDQMSLMKALETRDRIVLFEKDLESYITKKMKEAIPRLAKESGVDEATCERYFE